MCKEIIYRLSIKNMNTFQIFYLKLMRICVILITIILFIGAFLGFYFLFETIDQVKFFFNFRIVFVCK